MQNEMMNIPSCLYGESIFTSFRTLDGLVPGLDFHLMRLFSNVNDYYFLGKLKLTDFEKYFCAKSKVTAKLDLFPNHYFRLTIQAEKRNEIVPKSFSLEKLNLSITTKEILPHSSLELKLKTMDSPFSKHLIPMKSGSYSQSFYLRRKAMALGFDDVLFHRDGVITESSTSNIVFYDGVKYIFSNDPTNLDGTTQKLFKKFLNTESISFKETSINIRDLSKYRFAFHLNSSKFLTVIKNIDDINFECNTIIQKQFIDFLKRN